jgi:hypothetical protein
MIVKAEIAAEQGALAAIEEVNTFFLAMATLLGIQGTPEDAKSLLDFCLNITGPLKLKHIAALEKLKANA